jgi:hypothetical protein
MKYESGEPDERRDRLGVCSGKVVRMRGSWCRLYLVTFALTFATAATTATANAASYEA